MELKDQWIKFRVSKKTLSRGKHLALLYAEGNLTDWATHGLLNAPRKFLTESARQKTLGKRKKKS